MWQTENGSNLGLGRSAQLVGPGLKNSDLWGAGSPRDGYRQSSGATATQNELCSSIGRPVCASGANQEGSHEPGEDSSIDISSDELSLLRAPTLAPPSHNLLISRRTSKTAPFDQTEVLQTLDTSTSAFASARWSAHETEIWVGQPTGTLEKPYVSRLR